MRVSDIEEQIKELYDFEISNAPYFQNYQCRCNRSLTGKTIRWKIRLIVWMVIFFKVRENSKVINKTIYLAVDFGARPQSIEYRPSSYPNQNNPK